MKEKNKRNIVIGILCTLLVFMGVGYAALNQVLDINGTARSTNTWSIVIESITEKEKSLEGVVNKKATVGSDRISAEFEAEFTKPGDFITYEVVVKNEGTLPAKIDRINTVLPNKGALSQQELSDLSLFSMQCDETIVGKSLPAGASETFTVTVTYKTEATRLPYGDVHAGIEIVAVQDTTGGSGNVPATEEGDDWLYKVYSDEQDKENYGLITDFNYDSPQVQKDENGNYTIVVPAEIGGIPITSIDANSFARKELLMSRDYTKMVITDKANAAIIEEIANIVFPLLIGSMPTLYEEGTIDRTEFIPMHFDIQKYNEYVENNVEITVDNIFDILIFSVNKPIKTLDLSGATNLMTIGNNAFSQSQISGELVIPNSVTTIGDFAFSGNKISGLTLGKNVQEIGTRAFNFNQISSLIIPDNVITIADNAFESNKISGELTIPNSVTTIGNAAFSYNQISSLTIGSGITSIGSAFLFQRDSAGNGTLASITIKKPRADFEALLASGAVEFIWYDKKFISTITYDPS